MRFPFDKRLLFALGLMVGVLMAGAFLTFVNIRQLHQNSAWVIHTHRVIESLESVLTLAIDAETGERGYLLTGEAPYLEPYHEAVASMQGELDKLADLTVDNPAQQARVPEVKRLVAARLDLLDEAIKIYDAQGREAVREVILAGRGKAAMDALRRYIGDSLKLEDDLLDQRQAKAEQTFRSAVFSSLVASILALVMIGAFLFILQRHLQSRARAAAIIAQQRELFRTTIASIGDAVITTDARGRITSLNEVAEQLTGWIEAEALGKPLEEVFRIINEQTRQTVENPVHKVLERGLIVGLANHTVLIAKDGSARPIDDSAAPIRARSGGEMAGVVLVFRDVTQRKGIEDALRLAEEQFRTLADSIPQLAWIAEANGDITWYNRRWYEYTGTAPDQMMGWGWQSVHDPAELPRVIDKYRAHLTSGDDWEDTFPLRRHDGVMRWHLSRAIPVRDETGRIVRWFGTNTDVTEQREMAHSLRQLAADLSEANHRKDEFLATLAHELRNPLAPIRNALSIMKISTDSQQRFDETRDMMERQVLHMVRLIDDLMDLSRISRNRLDLRIEPIELEAAINQAIETCRPALDEARQELVVTLPPEPIWLDADLVRLAQVFSNLLHNASKYTGPGGRIALTVHREGEQVVASFVDNGVGIPAEMLPKVFDMFTQVDPTLERSQGGLGIGLTLVKRLVELHGGAVEAASAGLGHGSTFTVRLPILSQTAQAAPAIGPAADAKRDGKRVLVVDDNVDSTTSLAMLLRLTGNEVATAFDGVEAVATAEKFRPDVVLLDIGLPRMNGYEAARKIRQQPWGQKMVLVALTGWGQDEDRRKSKEAGFDHHLVKPVEHAALTKLMAGV